MKKSLFLLPLLALVMGACSPETNEEVNSGTSASVPGEVTTPNGGEGTPDAGGEGTPDAGGGETGGDTTTVTGITITPATAKIKLGASQKFNATLQPQGATGTVTWEIVELKQSKAKDEEPKVTVNAEGLVEVKKFAKVGKGNYQVKATCGNVSQTADIEIEDFNYGTLESPISTKDALNIIDWHPYESNGPEAYIKAYVTSNTKANEDGEINANIAYLDDGEAIYMRKATVKQGVTAGVKANDLTGKEIIIKSKVRLETNTQKKEFHYGEIQSVTTPVGTETPTKLVVSTKEAKVTSVEPLTINSYMLPMPAKGEIVWSVTPETAGITVNNGVVSATEAVADNTQVTVTATIKDTQIKQDIAVTVIKAINYGSVDAPLTISEADALIPSEGKTTQPLFVKGKITEINQSGDSATYNGYLTTNTKREFRFKKLTLDNNKAEEMKAKYVGREVIITGVGEVIDALPGMNNPTLAKLVPLAQAKTFTISNEKVSLYPEQFVDLDIVFPENTEGAVTLTTTSDQITIEGQRITVKETASTAGDVTVKVTLNGSEPEFSKDYTLTISLPSSDQVDVTFDVLAQYPTKDVKLFFDKEAIKFGTSPLEISIKNTVVNSDPNQKAYVKGGEYLQLNQKNEITYTAPSGYVIIGLKFIGEKGGTSTKITSEGATATTQGDNFIFSYETGKSSVVTKHNGSKYMAKKVIVSLQPVA